MTQPGPRGRSGITLIEILISILILGVGMVSIATLFPLGLLRVREAARLSRSATLTESATADLGTRNLLSKGSFQNSYSGIYYVNSLYTPWPYDPWTQDTPGYTVTGTVGKSVDPIKGPSPTFGAYRGSGAFDKNNPVGHDQLVPTGVISGPGLPVAYDPLWRYTTKIYLGAASEARFASGLGYVRADPDGGKASAHGLQRLTNFPPTSLISVPDIFVSPEDMVLQSATDSSKSVGGLSPIAPDLTLGSNTLTGMATPQYDWSYTWMFTGQQADATNGTVFSGDIVVFHNRPFALDQVTAPLDTSITTAVAGETVVEAIFGYTNSVTTTTSGTLGYGSNANRAVLLRWSDKIPDPEIRTGSWIADVTYERNAIVDLQRSYTDPNSGSAGGFYPFQRCYWYQIAKRTQPSVSTTLTGYREMTVWVSTPLKALTLLNVSDGSPVHVNAALVSPYVVNVFPRTIYTR